MRNVGLGIPPAQGGAKIIVFDHDGFSIGEIGDAVVLAEIPAAHGAGKGHVPEGFSRRGPDSGRPFVFAGLGGIPRRLPVNHKGSGPAFEE